MRLRRLLGRRTHQIDLFILDIQLPDYRGTQLGKHLRALPEYCFTPILFTTELDGETVSDNISGYSLVRLLELVGPGHLLQCHKSFLVNPLRISKLDKRTRQLWLTGCDTAIPIGEKYQHLSVC